MIRVLTITLITVICCAISASAAEPEGDCAMGFFYFKGHEHLSDPALRNAYVRTAIEWREYEPEQGTFNFGKGNKQDTAMNSLWAAGKRVVPSIRAKSDWATEPTEGKAAMAPRDLDRKTPLHLGGSYSPTYYAFVKRVAEQYKGKLSIVVIENEMNDADFWGSSIDDYLRVFSTAKKAFADVDSSVKLADGGTQGTVLNWLLLNQYLSKGQSEAASKFYERFSGRPIAAAELQQQWKRMTRKQGFKRAQELLRSPLFQWDDIVNFHYYQKAEGLPEIFQFLKASAPAGKPFLTNELGIKTQFTPTADEASVQMTKKIVQLLAYNVKPIIWFSPSGDEGHNAGALVDKQGNLRQPTTSTFQTIARYAGSARFYLHEERPDGWQKFQFRSDRGRADVVWSEKKGNLIPRVKKGNQFFDYSGKPLTADQLKDLAGPIYVVNESRLIIKSD